MALKPRQFFFSLPMYSLRGVVTDGELFELKFTALSGDMRVDGEDNAACVI